MLNRLRLGAIREQLDGLLEEAARRQLNLREALAWLCAAEVASKESGQGLAQIQLPPGCFLQQSVQLLADRAQPQPVEHPAEIQRLVEDLDDLSGSHARARWRRWLLRAAWHQPTSAATAA